MGRKMSWKEEGVVGMRNGKEEGVGGMRNGKEEGVGGDEV